MSEVDAFLEDAASLTGVDVATLLARVLHIENGGFAGEVAAMDEATRGLAFRLDRELRLRNPGLHYVPRKMFLGYRREGAASTPVGERSQIFVSVVRNNTRLEVVMPVDADSVTEMPNARDLRGTGHHGIGDVRVTLSTEEEIDQFLSDFDYWLRPPT